MNSDRLFRIIWRQTLTAMSLMILSNIGAVLLDGIIAARAFGADASAAMGLISPYFMLASLIGGLIGTGCQTLCAGAMSGGNSTGAQKTLATSFYFALAVALALSVLLFAFAAPIAAFLGAKGENAPLLSETAAYLRGVAIGTAPTVLNIILAPVAQLYGGKRQVKLSVTVIFLADVSFDLLAVALDMGCLGIGLATTLSTLLGTLIMLRFVLSNKTGIRLIITGFDLAALRPILKQGAPEAVKRFLRMGGDVFANYFVLLTASGAAMAGKTVGSLLASLLSVPGVGEASAMYLLSGVFIASADERSLFELGRRQVRVLLVTLALALSSIGLAPQITALMLKTDAQTMKTAVVCVRCILVQMPLYICFEAVTYYMQSIGRGKEANIMSLLGSTVFYFPLIVLMGRKAGAAGVLLSAPAALALTLVIFYIRLCVKLRRVATLRDIMHVSECIGVRKIDIIAQCSVESLEQTVQCSEEIRLALIKRSVDKRTAYAIALFTEELCANVLTHGKARQGLFSQGGGFASVFAYIDGDTVTLRIADNCALFDPAAKLAELERQQSEPESGLGLKAVFSMAHEASYTCLLNLNHMLIRVPIKGGRALGERKVPQIITPTHPGSN